MTAADYVPKLIGPCTSCGQPLVPQACDPVPAGFARHGGRGMCCSCYGRKKRAEDRATDPATEHDDSPVYGGGIPPLEVLDSGLCAQTDPEVFFPEKGGSTRNAKAVCSRCPVQEQCLEWALANNERFGIWGGKSERERRALRDERQEAVA